MENKLENIFVSYEIAKLAYEKGFNELCVCMASPKSGYFPNFGNNGNKEIIFFYNAQKFEFGYYFCPTHFQLMAWLQSSHNIHFSFDKSRKLSVFIPDKSSFRFIVEDGESEFEINKALELALNYLKDSQ